MKNFFGVLIGCSILFMSCSGSDENDEQLDNEPEIVLSYEEGGAQTASDFFDGAAGNLIQVDEKLRYVFELDDMNASVDSITEVLDSMSLMITEAKAVLSLYENKEWEKTSEFISLTNDWYNHVEGLIHNYYYKLAEPMSRPDESWSEEDIALYDEYEAAYYEFYEVDSRWVDFQETFAQANGFELAEDEHPL